MAAHRKPRQRLTAGSAARTAATLAFAGAATAAVLPGAAHADPAPTAAQVKAQVDRLYREAEAATEKYNGAKTEAAAAAKSVDALRDEAARRTQRLNAARDVLGAYAAAQYRSAGLDPSVQLALSSDPDQYLRRATYAEQAGERRATEVRSVRRQVAEIAQVRAEAAGKLTVLAAKQAALKEHRATVQAKLAEARRLLARLTPAERAAYDASEDGRGPGHADRSAPRGAVAAPNPRAAQAVAFAYSALGKPYVWGATGPASFDCSGLTQAAWRSAGVSLPRTTYTQINAGQRVPRSQLAPGDLVFFYSGISHVGLYIGNGKMIHAPRPGAPVRVAPIDEMPFAGATRVA
ncbi:NlpC/P60 family protein [Streptomyces sp. col6]|uniref:C40 family peptidase n=1 Tax=Streptomyces sp. col6 TaxID=2478958 RepID=UPI0011CEB654|nr:C40 family peptidase [Streptomyces sp. col6]TXS05795.1 NlpC/P60 family protein [Streptomyces sp. col6]